MRIYILISYWGSSWIKTNVTISITSCTTTHPGPEFSNEALFLIWKKWGSNEALQVVSFDLQQANLAFWGSVRLHSFAVMWKPIEGCKLHIFVFSLENKWNLTYFYTLMESFPKKSNVNFSPSTKKLTPNERKISYHENMRLCFVSA